MDTNTQWQKSTIAITINRRQWDSISRCLCAAIAAMATSCMAPLANPTASAPQPFPTTDPLSPFENQHKAKGTNTVTLTLSAAASLQDALQEVIAVYGQVNDSVTVVLNTASSGALQRQIEQGAPVDVFVPAALRHMDALQQQDLLLPGSRHDVLGNQLVLVTPKQEGQMAMKRAIATFTDLTRPEVTQIVMGHPDSVPAGVYGKDLLSRLNLYDQLKPKLVFAKDVRQALAYVESGQVSAGIVYATDAKTSAQLDVIADAPIQHHNPIVYPAAVLKQSRYPDESQALAEFLTSDMAQGIFERHGFRSIHSSREHSSHENSSRENSSHGNSSRE